MPESKPPKNQKTDEKAASQKSRKTPIPRRAKWAIVLLSVLCVLLLAALLEVAFLPQLIERDVNSLLQKMAGDGVEFRIKTISLTSAEVACKLKDTTRNGRPLNVGSIGSLSIRYSPLPLLLDRTIESIDIENCNVVADYSDGSISIPAYEIIAGSFLSGEKEEDGEPAPIDDLNAVVPVKIGRISLSGSLAAVARGEDTVDTLQIPYAVTVRPDTELGWNKLESSLMVHFATNGIRCKATYLHKEKKAVLELDDFTLATSALPGAVRSSLPRGFRAGVSLNAKAEIDLNGLTLEELDIGNSSLELSGDLTLGYRMPQGLRIDSVAPFSLKTVPRVIPTVKPMNPPKTETDLVLTLGALKGEYDEIPFELGGIEARVSPRRKTLQGVFQFIVADSEPAEFSFGGGMDNRIITLSLVLNNKPLLKAKYMGADASFRPEKLSAEMEVSDDGIIVKAPFSLRELQAAIDGGAFNPELKGMAASVIKPELVTGEFSMSGFRKEAAVDISGGEVSLKYMDMEVSFKPEDGSSDASRMLRAAFLQENEKKEVSAELAPGKLKFEKDGMEVTFRPQSFKADATLTDGIEKASAELRGDGLLAKLEGMACEAKTLTFKAGSEDGKKYQGDAKISAFQFKQTAAGLTYEAPEICLNKASFDLDGNILSGEVVCEDSRLVMPEMMLLAQNLHWDLPFDYSLAGAEPDSAEDAEKAPAAAPPAGKVSLGSVEYDGVKAASLDGTLQWDDTAKALHLKTDAKLLSIEGQICADIVLGRDDVEAECSIDIPEQDADLSKDLVGFLPQFAEISCTGKVKGNAVYKLLPTPATGHAEFHIADADIFIPEQKLEVRGVNLGFEIPEIAVMKSAPGQALTFKSVKYDRIETGAGRATFRMEAPDTWQVENALLDWCGGHIRLGGVTYRAGQTTTEAVLYCDRLELPLFLTQIGLGQISGRGSINGTIPVVLVQKKDSSGKAKIDNVYFEDAFLFSTPGEDGVIKGELDEALIDAGSGMEMELAKDALKDFTYSWVRMRMISSGPEKENLRLEFQLDGHPNRMLYYQFDENTASFIKSTTPCKFQGIRLDTNVNMYGKAMELVDYVQQIFSKGEIN